MDDFGGMGALEAMEIDVELSSNDSQRSKAEVFDAVLEYVQKEINKNATDNGDLNTIEFPQNSEVKHVLIRSISSRTKAYSVYMPYDGEAMFLANSDDGTDIKFNNLNYKIYFLDKEKYDLLKKIIRNRKNYIDKNNQSISGGLLSQVEPDEFDEEKFRNYFKP